MRRGPERELQRRLRALEAPDEAEAEERSWEVVRAAHAQRSPTPRRSPRRRALLAAAAGAAVLAIGLSPAGAEVGELAGDMVEAVGIGEDDARPALRSLPTEGELLVQSELGPWIVREDGSKRLLGDYRQASWSPRGLFVAAAAGRELVAVEPGGEVRWTITAPGPVRDPRWGGFGFDTRIAYRSGDDLRVVDGDGSDDRLVARDVAPVAPAWRPPPPEAKLGAGAHALTYVDRGRRIHTINVDTGKSIGEPTPRDLELLSTPPSGDTPSKRASSPDGDRMATIQRVGGRDELLLQRDGEGAGRVLFSARGELTGPTWSPDGDWLLVGWPDADQWLFIGTQPRGRVVAIDAITRQFDPGDTGRGSFPSVSGWILARR